MMMRQLHGAAEQNKCGHEKDDDATIDMFWLCSRAGNRGAQDQSANESADVAGVIDAAEQTSQKEIEYSEYNQAAQCPADGNAGQGKLA